ncbi:3-deoxy-manno-octulosonate cytidylyltransferase [Thiotrichales bacterium 19S11-10]|nr:3-deoxy-manno-octulosonate cytidylyltransferase [Thiotrichales bacterium 19S11-10]
MAKRIIIPARLASQRLPRKVLIDIHGKPIIQWVYEQSLACNFDSVLVATDSQEIADVVMSFGGEVCLTSSNHQTGTDRIAEAVQIKAYDSEDIIINIQGDEPLIPVENIRQVANNLIANPEAKMATLGERILDLNSMFDPNCVKVVTDKNGFALYFSRAPIPWVRDQFPQYLPENINCYRHIGMYAYRCAFLSQFSSLEESPLEAIEKLEQLRVLWHGEKIHFDAAFKPTPPGVDTQEDLTEVTLKLKDV